MRHKLCRSFPPWCPGVKNRCLCYFVTKPMHSPKFLHSLLYFLNNTIVKIVLYCMVINIPIAFVTQNVDFFGWYQSSIITFVWNPNWRFVCFSYSFCGSIHSLSYMGPSISRRVHAISQVTLNMFIKEGRGCNWCPLYQVLMKLVKASNDDFVLMRC